MADHLLLFEPENNTTSKTWGPKPKLITSNSNSSPKPHSSPAFRRGTNNEVKVDPNSLQNKNENLAHHQSVQRRSTSIPIPKQKGDFDKNERNFTFVGRLRSESEISGCVQAGFLNSSTGPPGSPNRSRIPVYNNTRQFSRTSINPQVFSPGPSSHASNSNGRTQLNSSWEDKNSQCPDLEHDSLEPLSTSWRSSSTQIESSVTNPVIHKKPRKWFSFTNLLSRGRGGGGIGGGGHGWSSLLSLPRSRLSVTSLFTRSSDESSGDVTPTEVGPGPPQPHAQVSPTPSAVTITGELPTHGGSTTNSPIVVFRKGRNGIGTQQQRSVSASAASGVSTVSFHSGTSGTQCQGSTHSRKSSSTLKNGNRLSCGDFFPGGTPNSPGFLGPDFQFHFYSGLKGSATLGPQGSRGVTGTAIVPEGSPFTTKRQFARSLPTLLEAMESPYNLHGNHLNGDSSDGPLTVDSVAGFLYQEIALLTGAKTRDDHYIIVLPDRGNFQLIGDDDFRRLMQYLISVPPMEDSEAGYVLVIDRRNDKWSSVKSTLQRISVHFPGVIHHVFVLRPIGFLQKALSEVSSKFFRTENLGFRLNICSHASDLNVAIDPSQLPTELGGSLSYDKVVWVQQRIEVEAFHTALQTLSRDLKTFTESFVDLEFPNDVHSTQKLIMDKEEEFSQLKTDLTQAGEHGESLLKRIKAGDSRDHSIHLEGGEGVKAHQTLDSSSSHSTQLVNVLSVERFILQIEETQRLFQEFWDKERIRLEDCLQLRKFETDFRECQVSFDLHVKHLNTTPDLEESIDKTEALISSTLTFQENCKTDIRRAMELEVAGRKLVSRNPGSIDTVEPKCVELSRMTSHFRFILQEKLNKQQRWYDIQNSLEKANQVCTEGMDLITAQQLIEAVEDLADWNRMKQDIDLLLQRLQIHLDLVTALKGTFAFEKPSHCKTLIKQVFARMEDVHSITLKRQAWLAQQIAKRTANLRGRRGSGSSGLTRMGSQSSAGSGDCDVSSVDGNVFSSESGIKSSLSSTTSTDSSNRVFPLEENHKDRSTKRRHILEELVNTEKSYVEEIGLILTGYRDQVRNPELQSILPIQLKGEFAANVGVLFCNLEDLYEFHSGIFLPDLQNCICISTETESHLDLVGLCFIQKNFEFLNMYSQYCQLTPASNTLLKEIGENHPWLNNCRVRLGQKLPLSSYLLKPVQRITKYHLLLSDLVQNSEGCKGFEELYEARKCMLAVTASLNEGMHQCHIRGYVGKLTDEGLLILHSPFRVWTDTAKNRLRLKGQSRYLFLYQKSILVCKKMGAQSSLSYEFKTKIDLREIGVTEALKGSGSTKKFEIWFQGRHKVFILQAPTHSVKEKWVTEIKRLLFEQLHSLRETKSGPSPSVNVNLPSGSGNTGLRRQKLVSQKGVTINGWRSGSTTHQKPVRQLSSWETPDMKALVRPKSRSMDTDAEEDPWSSDVSVSEDEESVSYPLVSAAHYGPNGGGSDPNTSHYRLRKSGSNSSVSLYELEEDTESLPKFVVQADYHPVGQSEIPLKKGDIVCLVEEGRAGWWFVQNMGIEPNSPVLKGWAPSAYLGKRPLSSGSQGSCSSSGFGASSCVSESTLESEFDRNGTLGVLSANSLSGVSHSQEPTPGDK